MFFVIAKGSHWRCRFMTPGLNFSLSACVSQLRIRTMMLDTVLAEKKDFKTRWPIKTTKCENQNYMQSVLGPKLHYFLPLLDTSVWLLETYLSCTGLSMFRADSLHIYTWINSIFCGRSQLLLGKQGWQFVPIMQH